jgi:predicted MFS family arabinose efflux permease
MTHAGHWTLERIAAVVAGSVALVVLNTLPAVTGVLARALGLGPEALGAYASADVLGITAGTLLAVPVMRIGSPRLAVLAGLGVLLVADLATAVSSATAALIALRALGGAGTGLTLGACFVVYAREERERNFAAYTLGQTGLATGAMAAIPVLAHACGWQAPFIGLAALVLPGLLLAPCLSGKRLAAVVTDAGSASDPESRPRPGPGTLLPWLGIVTVALFFLGQGSLWTYLDRIGSAAGIPDASIENSLTVCAAFGFLSGGLVLALGERVTRRRVLMMSVLINVVAAVAVDSPKAWIFAAAISVFYFSLPVFVAAQFAAITRLPGGDRYAVYTSTATFAGFGLGPLAGGALAGQLGFSAVRWLDIALVTSAGVLLLPLLRRGKEAAAAR